MIKVFIAKGPEQGRSFVLKDSAATIGKDLASEICLNESSVSRKHAVIHKDNDQYYVADLQSKNGTWIKESVIESGVRVPVQEGVPLGIGNVVVSLGKKCSLNRLPNH